LTQARQVDPTAPYVLEAGVADGTQVAARWTRTTQQRDPEPGQPVVVRTSGRLIAQVARGPHSRRGARPAAIAPSPPAAPPRGAIPQEGVLR